LHSGRVVPEVDAVISSDPTSGMRSYKKVGDRVLKTTIKRDGKVMVSGRQLPVQLRNTK
jgi:hypothetical protein